MADRILFELVSMYNSTSRCDFVLCAEPRKGTHTAYTIYCNMDYVLPVIVDNAFNHQRDDLAVNS